MVKYNGISHGPTTELHSYIFALFILAKHIPYRYSAFSFDTYSIHIIILLKKCMHNVSLWGKIAHTDFLSKEHEIMQLMKMHANKAVLTNAST